MKTKSLIAAAVLAQVATLGVAQADLLDQLQGGGIAGGSLGGTGSSDTSGNTQDDGTANNTGTGSGADSGSPDSGDANQGGGDTAAPSISELEPNDSRETATPLIPGEDFSGDAGPGDEDWFAFQATGSNSVMEISIPAQDGAWQMTVTDSQGRELATLNGGEEARRYVLVLSSSGSYFVRIQSSSAVSYRFSIDGDQLSLPGGSLFDQLMLTAIQEVEPNDHLLAAVPIEAGAVTGQLSSASDQDWFRLKTTAADVLVNLEVPAAPGGSVWQLTLMDAGGNVLSSWQTPAEGVLRASARLARADTYYLSVTAAGDSVTQEAYVFSLTGEALGDPGILNPLANFHDVEVESNDTPDQANPLAAAAAMRGQLLSDDVDWFRFEVAEPGNDIAFLELCPQGGPCVSDEGSSWVALVFDGAKLTPEMLGQPGVCMDGDNAIQTLHLYAQADSGVFGEALIASIDPSFGGNNQLELGFHQPGTYYVAILTRLERTDDGKVKCTQLFSDDMYQFNFALRGMAPLTEDNALIATLQGEELSVPVIQVGEQLYSARLQRRIDEDGQMRFELIEAVPLESALETVDYEPLTGRRTWTTLEGDIAHIPLVEYNGRYYAAELQISQEGGKTVLRVLRANRLD